MLQIVLLRPQYKTGQAFSMTWPPTYSELGVINRLQTSTGQVSQGLTSLSTVHLTEVDKVDLYFNTKLKPIIDFSACKDATLVPHSNVVNLEGSTKFIDIE